MLCLASYCCHFRAQGLCFCVFPNSPQAATQAFLRSCGDPELALESVSEMRACLLDGVSRALKTQSPSRDFLVFSSHVRSPVEPLDPTSRGQKHFIRYFICLYQKCLRNKSLPRVHDETRTGVTCCCTSLTLSMKRPVPAIFQKRKTSQ